MAREMKNSIDRSCQWNILAGLQSIRVRVLRSARLDCVQAPLKKTRMPIDSYTSIDIEDAAEYVLESPCLTSRRGEVTTHREGLS